MKSQALKSVSENECGDKNEQLEWDKVRVALRERVGETVYRRWLEPIEGAMSAGSDGVAQATLTLPTRFMRDWVEAHHGDVIRDMYRKLHDADVAFAVMSPLTKNAQIKNAIDTASAAPIAPLGRADEIASATVVAQPFTPQPSGFMADVSAELDPRFTFDNFVVGKPNELAYAAARRVADTENPAFNPLFLYGGVGLVKPI